MNLETWDNLPWTARGRKVKTTIEIIGGLAVLTIIAGISGMWQ